MKSDEAIDILSKKLEQLKEVSARHSYRDQPFIRWRFNTKKAVEKIFGVDSDNANDFKELRFSSMVLCITPDEEIQAFQSEVSRATALLASMIDELRDWGLPVGMETNEQSGPPNHLFNIDRICRRFHLVAKQLGQRRAGRQPFKIDDEYDVQDLLHSLLELYFDDIRPEEGAPSYAGAASRMDFLLPEIETVVETKMKRGSLSKKKLREELIVDKEQYRKHPQCRFLICMVYDPSGEISNPRGFEDDLTEGIDELTTRVLIVPKQD